MGSPSLYQRRKKYKLQPMQPRPEFATDSLPSHDRPHRTVPELVEHYPDVWLPAPTPEPVLVCVWDDPAAIWDETFGFDCEDES
jgi:hypothetical protein